MKLESIYLAFRTNSLHSQLISHTFIPGELVHILNFCIFVFHSRTSIKMNLPIKNHPHLIFKGWYTEFFNSKLRYYVCLINKFDFSLFIILQIFANRQTTSDYVMSVYIVCIVFSKAYYTVVYVPDTNYRHVAPLSGLQRATLQGYVNSKF